MQNYSPSAASTFLTGVSKSGPLSWGANGRTLKEIESELVNE